MSKDEGLETMKDGFVMHSGYSTHMPCLITAMQLIDKPVVELGGGPFSTPILHWLCEMKGLELTTYENDKDCYDFCKTFESKNHRVVFVTDWTTVPMDKQYGLVFIDHAPHKQRGSDAIRFKDNADYVVLHDTGVEKKFGYNEVWKHYKNRYNWTHQHPFTTVLSNKKELSGFKY